MKSHARLEFAEKGMHLSCIKATELCVGCDWYRTEVYRTEDGHLRVETYRQVGCYWKRERKGGALGSVQAMNRCGLLEEALTAEKKLGSTLG